MIRNKRGVSLIVLVITIMIRYDKWLKVRKIGNVPPDIKTKKLINKYKEVIKCNLQNHIEHDNIYHERKLNAYELYNTFNSTLQFKM